MGMTMAEFRRLGQQPAPAKVRAKYGTHSQRNAKERAQYIVTPEEQAWREEMETLPGLFLPIRTVNGLNTREHWTDREKRAAAQRMGTYAMLSQWIRSNRIGPGRFHVTLTRYGVGKMDKACGLNASLKHVRDGVADALLIDDGDEAACEWIYAPAVRCKFYGVRIEIQEV